MLEKVAFQYDQNNEWNPTKQEIMQLLRNKEIKQGQMIVLQQQPIKVLSTKPHQGYIGNNTQILLFPTSLSWKSALQKVTFLNLSEEKRETLPHLLINTHLSQDQLIDINGLQFQVINCVPENGIFRNDTDYRICNQEQQKIKEIIFCTSQPEKNDYIAQSLTQYYQIQRYAKEGQKIKIRGTDLILKSCRPHRQGLTDPTTKLVVVDQDQITLRSMNDDDDETEGLQLQINILKVLQDKTASRNQFSTKRKKLYSMMESFAQYDEKENQIILSQRDIQSNTQSINHFPNFPNTFLSQLQFKNEKPKQQQDEDLESDLMDSDEVNSGLGLQEQNDKLTQMSLPVFFKNILIDNNTQVSKQGATRQTILQQPAQPFSNDFSFESYEDSDHPNQLSDSSLIHEDLPHLTSLPRYFDEIIMLNSDRWLPLGGEGISQGKINQFPERKIDIQWIKEKGRELNVDFCKCMICLMDYADNEQVRTLPCLHYFHSECIDFWLVKNRRCPICKTGCDQAYNY